MTQDILCVISGVRPGGGPEHFSPAGAKAELRIELAKEISHLSTTGLLENEAAAILQDVPDFLSRSDNDSDNDFEISRPLGNWIHFNTCIAIGTFDESGGAFVARNPCTGCVTGIPRGRFVDTRAVCDESAGRFIRVVVGPDDPESDLFYDGVTHVKWKTTDCNPLGGNPNVFVLEGPFRYLEAWVDRASLPERRAVFPEDPDPLSFAAELYEIVNTRAQPRNEYDGSLPGIDYGGIEKTCEGTQDFFQPALKRPKHMTRAIDNGVRGGDLLPAITRDFGCWMCARPDIWPQPPDTIPAAVSAQSPSFESDEPSPTPFHMLPTELCLRILRTVPIQSILALASTCRSLRSLFGSSEFLNRVVREAILERRGPLRWVLPVATLPGEVERANDAAQAWLRVGAGHPGTYDGGSSAFAHPSFPYLDFLRACYDSDSMRNRQRFWDISRQFEVLWRNYRTKGWERNIISAHLPAA
ncbi:hypothetical protein BOTBODRAFT_142968 [Botryobasidium botryosum FD-172 SS1]|uniref:F-box domain-containing protein n=1 Tax=Botryobasidium botryosum (strain FD-172 SS1) TaxID=930990 RepID=A0A067MUZ4_BOTB1|nr:hypothetical protein BOTBODRAFT_142968 [Botryobasidium botryosum FD-172 SS1]